MEGVAARLYRVAVDEHEAQDDDEENRQHTARHAEIPGEKRHHAPLALIR